MAERTLYVHVGPPKTGSSAVKAFFGGDGVTGTLHPATGPWKDGAHHLLSMGLAGVARRVAVEIPPLSETLAALRAEIDGRPEDVRVSSEGFKPHTPAAFLKRLQPARHGFARIRTLFVPRDPVDLAASRYNKLVKDPVHGDSAHPDDFLRERAGIACLADVVRGFAEVAPASSSCATRRSKPSSPASSRPSTGPTWPRRTA